MLQRDGGRDWRGKERGEVERIGSLRKLSWEGEINDVNGTKKPKKLKCTPLCSLMECNGYLCAAWIIE